MIENKLPNVSIIMPVQNEGSYINQSVQSVVSQDYPKDLIEIIVVDGMSMDDTRAVASDFGVHTLDNPAKIVPNALNIGLAHSTGDIIIRIDGHCEIVSNYVSMCVQLLHETGAENVGGIQLAVGKNYISQATAAATSSPFGVGNSYFHFSKKPGWVDTVYLGAYRRDVFDRIGIFDEELVRNQDDEFNYRLRQAGGKIWFDPSLKVKYYCRSSFGKLWQQYFQYGLYKLRVIQKRKALLSLRHLIPSSFILGLISSLSIGLIYQNIFIGLVIIGPYAIINITASIISSRHNLKLLPLLPLTFFILHFSYGLGFLWGLWKWRKHWIK